jgi:hypothetical protein
MAPVKQDGTGKRVRWDLQLGQHMGEKGAKIPPKVSCPLPFSNVIIYETCSAIWHFYKSTFYRMCSSMWLHCHHNLLALALTNGCLV